MTFKIEHVAIWVKDLEKMCDFYVTHFNAQAGNRYHNPVKGFSSYFISFEEGCRLELMHRNGIVDGSLNERLGYAHFAFSLGSVQAVDQKTAQLRNANISVVDGPRTTGDGYYESVILDPEGNRIELTV